MILPPFELAVREAHAGSVMNSYADVDNVPAAADHWLLTDLLRDQWGFEGTVVSDYWAVPFLASMHQVAADFDQAGALALAAGMDVELPDTIGFGQGLAEKVRSGELAEELIDRAARRLLLQKAGLGLLDAGWTPEASVVGAERVELDSAANRQLAAELAERSVVLLDAGSALPLTGADRPGLSRIAVVGPAADDPRTFMGCYSFPNHVLPRYPRLGLGVDVPTALDALTAEFAESGTELTHARGCDVRAIGPVGFRRGGRGRPGRRRLPGLRRGSGRSVRQRHLGRGVRRRGSATARGAGRVGGGVVGHRDAGGGDRGLRTSVRPGRVRRPGRRSGAGLHAG